MLPTENVYIDIFFFFFWLKEVHGMGHFNEIENTK